MPLTPSRAKKLIANATASSRVSDAEVESLQQHFSELNDSGFSSRNSESERSFVDTGNEVFMSTGPVDDWLVRKLRRELKGPRAFMRRFLFKEA